MSFLYFCFTDVEKGEAIEIPDNDNDEEEEFSGALKKLFLIPYREMDFTEQLWGYLKG